MKRWMIEVSDETVRPRGSQDCLNRAVERLLDLRGKSEGATIALESSVDLPIQKLRKLARQQIRLLAEAYNRQVSLEVGAPRYPGVIDEIDAIRKPLEEVIHRLESTNDITRHILLTGGSGIIFPSRWFQEANIYELPSPGRNGKSAAVGGLQSILHFLMQAQENFVRSKGDAADKGGKTNLYKQLYGSAQANLVLQGWFIHEQFGPGMSRGTDGGPFHLFLLDAYEYATGCDPESTSLMPLIKRICKAMRKAETLHRQEMSLIDQQVAIDDPDLKINLAEREKRLLEVGQKLLALQAEWLDLWPKIYPYAYQGQGK
jgi:hypothetical protein